MSEYRCECAECDGWADEPYLPVDTAPAPRVGIRATLEAMGKLGTVSGGPVPGAGPCPFCGGAFPPYYRHACVSQAPERSADANNGLDGVLRAAGGEPVPDIEFIEFDMPVPDGTGTRPAPEDCTCGNPSRYTIPPPCPAHSGVVREPSPWLDALNRL